MSNSNRNRQGNRSSQQKSGNADGNASQQTSIQESIAEREAEINKQEEKAGETLEQLRSKLAEQEKRAAELQAENESLRQSQEGDRGFADLNPGARPQVGPDGGYKFRVESRKKGTKLQPAEVRACDESEAIRYYCCVTENPDKPGKQIRAENELLYATCLEQSNRDERTRHARRIAQLRRKDQQGTPLTEREVEELEAEEERRAAVPSDR